MELSVSVLNAKDKIKIIKKLNKSKIKYYHIDVMDGKFVSQLSLPIQEIQKINNVSTKELDVHLMVENPLPYIDAIKELNVKYITIHLEINQDIKMLIDRIKSYGIKAGISIKPTTPVDKLIPYLNDIDLILIMSVEPGLGGQPFITSSKERVQEIKDLTSQHSNIKLSIDGGINDKTLLKVKNVDIVVVGSFITTSSEPLKQIEKLLV